MSWDRHLAWHVVDLDGCVVGSWGIEDRAAEQAREFGGHYELVVNVIAGWGPKSSVLTHAPHRERLVLRHEESGAVTYEHPDWPSWAARIGVENREARHAAE